MEFNILLFLANNPEFDTAAQIIKKRAFTKSHVSMSVRSLEERGLLTGEYYGTDRRTIHLNSRTLLRRWSLTGKTSRNGPPRSSAADSPRKSTGCCSNL